MSNNEPTGEKSTALPRSDVQIVHGLCHDCPDYEQLYRAPEAADAIEAAIEDAIEHARATGHEGVDHKLLTEPPLEICDRCDEPMHSQVQTGPSPADASNQPCGCTPTEASD